MKAQSDIVNEIQEREASCEALKDDKESIQQQLQDTEKSKQMVDLLCTLQCLFLCPLCVCVCVCK